jgi:misacylated tRNA(Ala) deacylase
MHTAQHLVSAAADELFSATTIGNQINTQKTRIDIGIESRDSFSKDDLESSVNNYIDSAVDVSMSFRPRDELIEDPLVRVNMDLIPKNIHELRVITIDGIDICPCAGTHVGNTNQIGYIEIGKVKSKGAGKLRVEYTLVD